ncbi:dTMP kinase [Vibrio sp.]|nr:dTMP kinase [Vibrio sp.]
MNLGKFIVIEGLEGAGKSTAIEAIKQQLDVMVDSEYIQTREPGGTPLAEQLRDLVKADHEEVLHDKTELLLMYASRVQLVENVIKPALNKGTWVIGDRHDLSSQAYQGGGRGIDSKLMQSLKLTTLGDFAPDLTFYLDIDPKIGLNRARGRGELDRIEKMDLSFFERTREMYLSFANNDSSIVIIDAEQSIEQVAFDIKQKLKIWLKETQSIHSDRGAC